MEEQLQNELETKLTDALLDLWQSNSEGSYDVQLADTCGKQLRAKLRSAENAKRHAARAASDAV